MTVVVSSGSLVTANDIITRALKIIKVLGDSEAPSSTEARDGLVSLNAMMKTWSAQSLMVFQIQQEVFQGIVTTSAQSYTIGPGQTLDTTRPIQIVDGSFVRLPAPSQPVDFHLDIIDRAQWDAIVLKNTKGIPGRIFFDTGWPNGTINLYYWPDRAYDLHLNSLKPLTQFSSLTADISMPPEYEECVVFNLAIRLAPEFHGEVTPEIVRIAAETKGIVKAINTQDQKTVAEFALSQRGKFNIYSGYSW